MCVYFRCKYVLLWCFSIKDEFVWREWELEKWVFFGESWWCGHHRDVTKFVCQCVENIDGVKERKAEQSWLNQLGRLVVFVVVCFSFKCIFFVILMGFYTIFIHGWIICTTVFNFMKIIECQKVVAVEIFWKNFFQKMLFFFAQYLPEPSFGLLSPGPFFLKHWQNCTCVASQIQFWVNVLNKNNKNSDEPTINKSAMRLARCCLWVGIYTALYLPPPLSHTTNMPTQHPLQIYPNAITTPTSTPTRTICITTPHSPLLLPTPPACPHCRPRVPRHLFTVYHRNYQQQQITTNSKNFCQSALLLTRRSLVKKRCQHYNLQCV